MSDTTSQRDHMAAYVEASLVAAWLHCCGPSGDPGEWFAGTFIDILEDENELSLHPTWVKLGSDGRRMFSAMFRDDCHEEAWEWHIGGVHADSGLKRSAIDALDDLGACWDEYSISFFASGDHHQRPPAPAEVVDALLVLNDETSYE